MSSKKSLSSGTAFGSDHFLDAYPDGIGQHFWNLARNRLVYQKLKHFPANNNILEIGCGRGVVIDYLRRLSLRCWGCDTGLATPISEQVQPFLHLGKNAFDMEKPFRDKINTLLVLDVLEHLPIPSEFIKTCRASFPNATHMIITLPARKELWSNYDEYYGHLLRYDKDSVRKLLTDSGLIEIQIGYFYQSLYLVARLLSLFRINRRTKLDAPRNKWSIMAHDAVARWVVIEERIAPRWFAGSSIFVIARL